MTTLVPRSYQDARTKAGLLAAIERVVAFLQQGLQRQRTRRQLASLDDRMLKDIGISRCEVELELRRPWWRYQ